MTTTTTTTTTIDPAHKALLASLDEVRQMLLCIRQHAADLREIAKPRDGFDAWEVERELDGIAEGVTIALGELVGVENAASDLADEVR